MASGTEVMHFTLKAGPYIIQTIPQTLAIIAPSIVSMKLRTPRPKKNGEPLDKRSLGP